MAVRAPVATLVLLAVLGLLPRPATAADACLLLSASELEAAFGEPLATALPGSAAGPDAFTESCQRFGSERPFFSITVAVTQPTSMLDPVLWFAVMRELAQQQCRTLGSETIKRITLHRVRDLGEDAYACSYGIYVGDTVMGGVVWLQAVGKGQLLSLTVSAREPETLAQAKALAALALERLP